MTLSSQTKCEFYRWLDDETLTQITPKLIGKKPNTYTYTKHLAESLLVSEGHDLPVCIVRPSVVTAMYKDPLPVSECLNVDFAPDMPDG